MNLLMKDLFKLKFIDDVLNKSKNLAHFVKYRRGLSYRFQRMQKALRKNGEKRRRLSLPVPTRWYTHEKRIASVYHNKDILAAIFSDTALLKSYEGDALDKSLAAFYDDGFWQDTQIVLSLIEPINKSLAAFERDNCSISLVTTSSSGSEKNCSKEVILAILLDHSKPMYDHENADTKARINAAKELVLEMELIPDALGDEFHLQLQNFVIAKSEWTGRTRVDYHCYSPINWWAIETSRTYHLVQEFAKLSLYVPTSSASCERSWSIFAFIHTKLRIRLTSDRVNKRVFVYTNLARKSEANNVLYQLYPDAGGESDSSDDSSSSDDSEPETALYASHSHASAPATSKIDLEAASNVGKAGYMGFVKKLKEYIVDGDIFQAVPSQLLAVDLPKDATPLDLYRQMRVINPPPYMFFLDMVMISRLLAHHPRLDHDRIVETHPIAGTRHRGANDEEDEALVKHLLPRLSLHFTDGDHPGRVLCATGNSHQVLDVVLTP
ncbi:hypothetical protein F442_03631 [Phytophthora nicotianae P10297]|uniref:HAT C-terminal dimerisation domain-containing protein n=1 Tax=Phytophthora nicotianae P10297 TaxID=1317064 RepID=W2ZV93_PHYNI|nr:hypothetical protein F442_03631 [Phytophthora nicotianae P10297]